MGDTGEATRKVVRGVICQAFGCDEVLAETIHAFARALHVSRGQVLWPLAERDETSLLATGRAHEVAYGRDGGMLVLHLIAPGEFYGGLFGSGDSEATSRTEALANSLVANFATASVLRLMAGYSCVALAIARQMAARMEAMRRRMVETTLLSATGRICAELLRQARATNDTTIRPVPVFTDLAVSVQSTRETVSRTISQLEKRGILKRIDGGLQVVAPHRLEEMVY